MKIAMLITVIFLVLLLLSFFTFTLLTAIRRAEFEEALAPVNKKPKQEE
ncbi:MAG TPA: hypothetical protein VE710_21635 [Candidatus Bathyarchaeia archaeon]|nr:hypothetical protein [Candidatus Bathyarchaeia archaeon]